MLESLHVKDLALVKEVEIDFHDGFNILTGETGAGKSIIMGSVNLALGAKASADLIRSGAEYALVELVFRLDEKEISKLKELELEPEEDGTILLQRKISSQKTVSRINGQTVTVSQLKELSNVLMDVYGQHDYQNLLKPSNYLKMLDEYAGEKVFVLTDELKKKYSAYKDLLKKRNDDNSDENVRNREIDLLRYEINEIEEASLTLGEDEELEKRFRFLSNVRKIMEAVYEASNAIDGEDASALTNVGHATMKLKSVSAYDEEASEIADRIEEIEGLLSDAKRALKSYESKLDFDEEEFALVEERLNLLNHLKDKYGNTIESILSLYEKKSEELEKYIHYEEYLLKLDKEIEVLQKDILEICAKVSNHRKIAAKGLEQKLTDELKSLNFINTDMKITVLSEEEKLSVNGFDTVEFLISTNIGEELRPMHQIASGGELSRIMLAIKSVFADRDDVSTLLFDEIDSGISGTTAYKVAEMMSRIAGNHQLIAITHLPQIASMADNHYRIEKKVVEDRTVTLISRLDEEDSVRELARMLGSDEITDSALNNARELKKKKVCS